MPLQFKHLLPESIFSVETAHDCDREDVFEQRH